ncbi:MAG: glycosyltransferase family 4 protein [Planctomycetes bacterium]|nr:glycosyltransferase family 4 protein [Planctomycetota bacterium]
MTNEDAGAFRAALVIDQRTFDRLGPVIEHLSVGLLDFVSEVILITPATAARRLSLGPVRVIEHPRLRWPMRDRTVQQILSELKRQPPTVIHAITSRSFGLADELALETGRPLVGHLLGSEDLHPKDSGVFGRMKKLIAASKPLLEAACERHLLDAEDIVLVRPGLLPASAPTCFDHEDRIPTMLCMSAFESSTGVDRLIRATKILITEKHDLMLFLVATGRMESRLRKLVEKENLIKHVTIGLPLTNWSAAMRAADIFVVPGDVDRVDVRLLHALAAGMAAVTGAMPNSDFVIDNRTVLVRPDPSSEALAGAIRQLLRDRAAARLLASRALEHCKNKHSLSEMARETARVYREVSELERGANLSH